MATIAKKIFKHKGESFEVVTQEDGNGYTINYDGMVLKTNVSSLDTSVRIAERFIERYGKKAQSKES